MRTIEDLHNAFDELERVADDHLPGALVHTQDHPGVPRRGRFLAPTLAAAVVALVVAGVVAGAASRGGHAPRPAAAGDPAVVASPSWKCPSGSAPVSSYAVSLDANGQDQLRTVNESCQGVGAGLHWSSPPNGSVAIVTVWPKGAYKPTRVNDEAQVTVGGVTGYFQSSTASAVPGGYQPATALLFWSYAPDSYVSVDSQGVGVQALPASSAQLVAIAEGKSWRGRIVTAPIKFSEAPNGLSLIGVTSSETAADITLNFAGADNNSVMGVTVMKSDRLVTCCGADALTIDGHPASYESGVGSAPPSLEVLFGEWRVDLNADDAQPKLSQTELVEVARTITTASSTSDRSTWFSMDAVIP